MRNTLRGQACCIREADIRLVLLLLLLALIFGGVGLFVQGLKWLLIIAVVFLILGFFTGYRRRGV